MGALFPFEIATKDSVQVATNGKVTVTRFLDEGGAMFKRRAVTVSTAPPLGEGLIPQLNQLSTDLLKNSSIPAEQIAARLRELADRMVPAVPVPKAEWAVVRLDGVSVYISDTDVLVTRRDLTP